MLNIRNMDMKVENLSRKKFVLLFLIGILFLFSCTKQSQLVGDGGIRTWIEVSDSKYKRGFVLLENNYGIFINSYEGKQSISQIDLYDAEPRLIKKCIFHWDLSKNDLIFELYSKYSFKFRLLFLSNDSLKLQQDTVIRTYYRDTSS